MKQLVYSALLFSACALGGQSFMPPNDLYLEDRREQVNNISEEEFKERVALVEAKYAPIVDILKGQLVIEADWGDSTVNAYANRDGKRWVVHMYGGLARRPEITPDGFSLVMCHELGHHVGGFPFHPRQGWPAANEGQSDYFATLSCGKILFGADYEVNAAFERVIPEYPKAKCDAAFELPRERHLCYRLAMAGKSLADLLSRGRAKFESPDPAIAAETYHGHGPTGQCRLDSYLAGALCAVDFDALKIPQDEKSSAKVSCLRSKGQVGARPRCWFKDKI